MARDIAGDIRLDPRIKVFLADDEAEPEGNVDSRETLLAEANSEEARAGAEQFRQFAEQFDTEEVAPSSGLRVHAESVLTRCHSRAGRALQVRKSSSGARVSTHHARHGLNRDHSSSQRRRLMPLTKLDCR
jgi:hypothetical protein